MPGMWGVPLPCSLTMAPSTASMTPTATAAPRPHARRKLRCTVRRGLGVAGSGAAGAGAAGAASLGVEAIPASFPTVSPPLARLR